MAYRYSVAQSINLRSRLPAFVALAVITMVMALSGRAHAEQARAFVETAPRPAGEPVMAIVSIKSQIVTFYDSDGWILRAPVSTGVKGRETPAGVFAILQKNVDHRSNLYDDARMPHMQRLTWNGIAMHGGPLPGYAASHGCVRMPFDFAETLFDKTRLGMRVIISPDDAAPEDVAHPALLVPDPKSVTEAPVRAETLDQEVAEAAKAVEATKKAAKAAERDADKAKTSLTKAQAMKSRADADLKSAEKTLASITKDNDKGRLQAEERKLKATTMAADADKRLDDAKADVKAKLEAAAMAKDAAKAAADSAIDATKAEIKTATAQVKTAAKTADRDAQKAKGSLSKAQALKTKADQDVKAAEKALATAMKGEAKTRAEDRKVKAAAKATEAATRFDSAKAEAASKLDAATRAKDAAKAAAVKLADLTKAAEEAKLALQPVAVYISREKQMLYVRRTTGKPWPDGGEVFDSSIEVPVTIRDPDQPIGTHIFTAMANIGQGLRWSAVTIDGGDNAQNALDRITIPKDVLDRIAPTTLPRSSIIISDEPLSRETNYRTEFVAVLSNQPQGGFKTRRPTPPRVLQPSVTTPWNNGGGFFSFFDAPSPPPRPIAKKPPRPSKQQVQQGWSW